MQQRTPGQPSKGHRRALTTRVPAGHADVYTREAERLGLKRSDYIAWFLAQGHGLDEPAWLQRNRGQQELPTTGGDDQDSDPLSA